MERRRHHRAVEEDHPLRYIYYSTLWIPAYKLIQAAHDGNRSFPERVLRTGFAESELIQRRPDLTSAKPAILVSRASLSLYHILSYNGLHEDMLKGGLSPCD